MRLKPSAAPRPRPRAATSATPPRSAALGARREHNSMRRVLRTLRPRFLHGRPVPLYEGALSRRTAPYKCTRVPQWPHVPSGEGGSSGRRREHYTGEFTARQGCDQPGRSGPRRSGPLWCVQGRRARRAEVAFSQGAAGAAPAAVRLAQEHYRGALWAPTDAP